MKVYRGSAAAARSYVEADRSRADDYYLAEGTGLAQRYVASPLGGALGERVGEPGQGCGARGAGTLDGDAYESWVAGYDQNGAAKGRLRTDAQGVRFVEVIVNGPKSWSLAAVLSPEVAAAYDAAQERAAVQIIGWLAEHATTRVGPRGRQVQVPVGQIEAAVIGHYTSRAGDPHRHLHLQVNARVFAEGKWRGLHTLGVRDSLDALNGIGHAAVMCDPEFRATLQAHGYNLDPESGEVVQLATYVGAFSARAAQIGRNIEGYEAQWRTANPNQEPGPKLRSTWDARAWAQARPDKVIPTDGAGLAARWVEELHDLGCPTPSTPGQPARSAALPAALSVVPVGELDRTQAVATVLARLGARRSGWNGADVRGEVEQLIARTGLVSEPAVRIELAEDLTARTLETCVRLLDQPGVPEHIRALTSREVLAVEADLTTRLAARSQAEPTHTELVPAVLDGLDGLDVAQRAVVAGLAGNRSLVVVEGAAGAGKTTTLAATRAAVEGQGRRLVVVTPTLKAAGVAAQQLGTRAFSAAWLAHQYGWRWDENGTWTRLHPGDTDPLSAHGTVYAGPKPAAVLRPGDLLLVDEAGMLDQDTARALLVLADETGARVGLVGDRHQLPAVGRGGVLDLAARWVDPGAHLSLERVHRFADPDYAQLSLAMRTGADPGAVFDALVSRGQIWLHPSEAERTLTLAEAGTAAGGETRGEAGGEMPGGGGRVLVLADTREQVAVLNAAIRDRLVAAGRVDDVATVTTTAGVRIGVGDRVATRHNNPALEVANRDVWTVTDIHRDGGLTLAPGNHRARPRRGQLSGEPGGERRGEVHLPAGYVRPWVELAYASTVYGAQGETVQRAHLVFGEHTGAAAAYVAMTRGRQANTAHLVAEDLTAARGQWIAAFGRDRADLGPAHAAQLAAIEAAPYAPARALEPVLADLRLAWTRQADLQQKHQELVELRDGYQHAAVTRARYDPALQQLTRAEAAARDRWRAAYDRATELDATLAAEHHQLEATTWGAWHTDLPAAHHAAATIRQGTGRFGKHRTKVRDARADLAAWADTWRPIVPHLARDLDELAEDLHWGIGGDRLRDAVEADIVRVLEYAHPEADQVHTEAEASWPAYLHAEDARKDLDEELFTQLRPYQHLYNHTDLDTELDQTQARLAEVERDLATATGRVHALCREPALRALPAGRLETEHQTWQVDRDQDRRHRAKATAVRTRRSTPSYPSMNYHPPTPDRRGPSIGF